MLEVSIDPYRVRVGQRFTASFQRTLRIPEDDRVYPLPPGLGAFPVHRVEDYASRAPAAWREPGGVFIPMYQREAMWLAFGAAYWKPNAVKIGVGKVNAVSGGAWDEKLREDPQDYIVCPEQPWLDGINAGDGFIRQFVAMPMGQGHTVEGQVTGAEEFGGVQILVYEPRPGNFPDEPQPRHDSMPEMPQAVAEAASGEMGLGAGGRIRQKIYPDPYGVEVWDPENRGQVFVHIVNSEQYRKLTGLEPPPTPVSVQTYVEHGLPWFDLYDEAEGDVAPPEQLTSVKTIEEKDAETGVEAEQGVASVDVNETDIKKLRRSKRGEDDG
jgi:hypothetical protein